MEDQYKDLLLALLMSKERYERDIEYHKDLYEKEVARIDSEYLKLIHGE